MIKDITQDLLKELLYYVPETGVFTWKHRKREWFKTDRDCKAWNSCNAWKEAGSICPNKGYRYISIFSKAYPAHGIAWKYAHGEFPVYNIDHINGRKDDNRLKNLRDVTHLENSRNKPKREDNASGVMGIIWDKSRERWMAYIGLEGKFKNLGRFKNKDDAIKARKDAEKEYGFHENHGRAE